MNILLVILGGGLGSACRYLFSQAATRWFGSQFPWGTLGVNLVGCLLIGIGFALAEKSIINSSVRLLFMTGFLGGLTTFSTYALETINFAQNNELGMFALNFTVNNLCGLVLVFIGLGIGRLI
jgi:CrcB protein